MAEAGGFIEVMKDAISAIAPGLENFGQEVGAELSRLGTQGAAELASALFSDSNAYVPYGQGQYTPSIEGPEQAVLSVEAPQQERGGMEM
jgi:hypothetical protein